jgi:hypothetical protein
LIAAIFSCRRSTEAAPDPPSSSRSANIELVEIASQPRVTLGQRLVEPRLREVALPAVHRFDPRPVHGDQFAAEEVEIPAQGHELPKHLAEGVPVRAPEICDGLEVRRQPAKEPDHLDVAMGLGLQPPARPDAIQVTVDIELQEVAGTITGSARILGNRADETEFGEIEPRDESFNEAHRIVCTDIGLDRFRQKHQLRSINTRYVRHARLYRHPACPGIPKRFHTVWFATIH